MSNSTRSRERTKALEKKASLEPKDAELTINLGEAYLREGRLEEAAQAYARAAELDPRTEFRALYWEWLGLVRETREELEQALEAYDNWADADPSSVEPVDRAGTLLVALGRWTDLALLRPQYERRAEGNSDFKLLESLALFTYVMEQLGATEDPSPMARAYAALEIENRSIAMRYLLGMLFLRSGQLEAANAEFLRVLELDSDRTWLEKRFSLGWRASSAWLMLGRIARLQGRVAEALQHLQSCLQTSLDNLEPLEEMVSLLVEQELYEEALALLPEPEGPDDLEIPPWIRRLRTRCLLGLGRVEEAARLVEPGKPASSTRPRKDPGPDTRFRARLDQAQKHLQAGRFQEAHNAYASLGPARRRPPEVRLGMAQAATGLGRPKDAIRQSEILVREAPDHAEAWSLLAEAYRQTGSTIRRRLALAQLEAVRLGP
ncbi:MAG: tetratricopeptide repeat protein, partial [Burkholderiales bacterium]|nr:tetratricopeptide repeat protein [Burkholderiales bacterium]